MYEHRNQKPVTKGVFYKRVLWSVILAVLVMGGSLVIGVLGYHFTENQPWIDALLNASMILGGMGPVDPVKTVCGKLFASFYALYSGLMLIGLMGLLLGPVFHRILHTFHDETRE